MARVALSSPWEIYYSEVKELFRYDPEVHVLYDDEKKTISLYVDNMAKADALGEILPEEKVLGNVSVYLDIISANDAKNLAEDYTGTIYERAFRGNPAFSYVHRVTGVFSYNVIYVVFANRVVQFFTDNLADVNGNCSTLYETIAGDVLLRPVGVYFCTDIEHPVYNHSVSLGKPLGEWP